MRVVKGGKDGERCRERGRMKEKKREVEVERKSKKGSDLISRFLFWWRKVSRAVHSCLGIGLKSRGHSSE